MKPNDNSTKLTRRDFGRLSAAALSGLMTGALVSGCGGTSAGPEAASTAGSTTGTAMASSGVQAAGLALLLQEPHVCRGLNTCKGKGAGKDNQCAGMGTCATADHHSCQGENACKGQGGCDTTAGQNSCKGQGNCSVPLKAETWAKARAAFERQAAAANITVHPAPAQ